MVLTPLEVLRESLTHWRATKHPRFADLADWATTRALAAEAPRPPLETQQWQEVFEKQDLLDLPRLVAGIGAGREATTRITLLSRLDDPRVTTGLLAFLAAPPSTARTAIVILRAAAAALLQTGDQRVHHRLAALAASYRAVIDSAMGDVVGAMLVRIADTAAEEPAPLTEELETKCAELEAVFETERTQLQREVSRRRAAKRDDEGLLAAIYAAPHDDGPRLVFADALTERGDPRGEFIALQLKRAKGNPTPEDLVRERTLSSDPKVRMAWSLPLSRGANCHVARGFPDGIAVEPRTFQSIIREPALRTVHSVSGLENRPSLKQLRMFLTSHSHFHSVGQLKREQLEALLAPLPWRAVALDFMPELLHRSYFVNTREFMVSSRGYQRATPALMEHFTALEKLKIQDIDPEALDSLSELTELETHSAPQLRSLKKLRRLKTNAVPVAEEVAGLELEALSFFHSDEVDFEPLIEALPKLTELRVRTNDSHSEVTFGRLMASKRFSKLDLLQFGISNLFDFRKPWTPEGTLDVRITDMRYFYGEGVRYVLANVSPECVSKIRLRPHTSDPWEPLKYVMTAAEAEELGRIAKVPVELAWY